MIAAERVSGRSSPIDDLGPREVEVLKLLAAGNSTEEASELLPLSHKTVQNYHSTIRSKLNASNDAKLVWISIAAGLLKATEVGDMNEGSPSGSSARTCKLLKESLVVSERGLATMKGRHDYF